MVTDLDRALELAERIVANGQPGSDLVLLASQFLIARQGFVRTRAALLAALPVLMERQRPRRVK